MNPNTLQLIKKIDNLWEPVYPYLAQHIQELYGREDGKILEIGPFCGVIFALCQKDIGDSFFLAAFPPGMGDFFRQQVKDRKREKDFRVIDSDPSLAGVNDDTIDLAIFRGAFFFPALGEADLGEIHRVLRPNGIGFIGGGFGKYTPEGIIQDIGKESRDLNLRLGRIHITEDKLRQDVQAAGLQEKVKLISEGGLWVQIIK